MEIGMQIILCMHALWLQIHPCLMGNMGACIFLASVVDSPHLLQSLHVPYHTLTCTLHVYYPTVRPVVSRSLFLDILVVLLLGDYTLFALQISTNPLPGYAHIFNNICSTITCGGMSEKLKL